MPAPSAVGGPAVTGSPPPRAPKPRLRPPPRDVIESLPPFEALDLDRIEVVTDEAALARVLPLLLARPVLGFDTESKPTFVRGQVSDGPHLVQFADAERAWLLPLFVPGALAAVAQVLASQAVLKVGFGLDSDRALLTRRIGEAPRAVLDLDSLFRALGYPPSLGLKSSVAVVLGRCFTKSKRVGTSNWSIQELSPAQLRYAANDAFGAYRVHAAMLADPQRFMPAAGAGEQG